MRIVAFLALLGALSTKGQAEEKAVQTFDGTGSSTTAPFTVRGTWEIRWDSPSLIAITLFAPDHSIVVGAAGSQKGSLYQPAGGVFTLQIDGSGTGPSAAWHVSVVELGSTPDGSTNLTSSANYVPPAGAATTVANATAQPSPAAPPPPAAPSPAAGLTEAQAHAVVLVKGDVAEGTGFLVKTADGHPAVITNLHVVSANPNVKILTTTGAQIKTLGLKGASDRDLAMFLIQDDHYAYLDLATDVQNSVQPGDQVITPGNSEGGEVMLNTKGEVLGIGPDKVEIDNPIYHGNSGGPIFHVASGKVIAVVTAARRVNVSDDLDKTSFVSKNSAIGSTMRYFGLRVDTVPHWDDYDWDRFLAETTFLKNFQDQSRCLDSYLNGSRYEKAHVASTDPEAGPPDSHYYLRNDKIQAAHDTYHRLGTDSDNSQRLDAVRGLVMDLEGIADIDMPTIQNPANFYTFDQLKAKQEIAYRKALRTEIDNIGSKVSDLGH